VSRYDKGKTNLDSTGARDSEWQWHQLGHMQVCISLQTDNHASTPPLSFYRLDALPAAQPTASKHEAGCMKVSGVCLSVLSSSAARLCGRVCCCAPGGQEISIDCCTAGAQQQMQAVSRCYLNTDSLKSLTGAKDIAKYK